MQHECIMYLDGAIYIYELYIALISACHIASDASQPHKIMHLKLSTMRSRGGWSLAI